MAKCIRCGRKGLFLKLKDGLCSNCAKLIQVECEVADLETRREAAQTVLDNMASEKGALVNEMDELRKKSEEYSKVVEEARREGIAQAERDMAQRIAENDALIAEKQQQIAEAEAHLAEVEASADSASKKLRTTQRQYDSIRPLVRAIKKSATLSPDEFPIEAAALARRYDELEALLVPTVTMDLQCMGMRELRKRFKANDKLIDQVVEKYRSRYKTKTTAALYSLMCIALRAELQNTLYSLKFGGLDKALELLGEFTQKYYLIAAEGNQAIAPTLRTFVGEISSLFENSIRIEYEYHVQKERAREEQRAIREQIRQEAEDRRALEAERKKVEKEEAKYTTQIDSIQEQLQTAQDADRIAQLEARLRELEEQKAAVEEKKSQIITLQNGKAGNVYVISNLGAFGDDVFKVGMTRRADPQDRIDELGSASVPFPFDVHSFIFSDDAVALEGKIHAILNDRRVNKVNLRKEFFRISLDELEQLVLDLEPTADFKRTMVAEQYRQSLSINHVAEAAADEGDADDDSDDAGDD